MLETILEVNLYIGFTSRFKPLYSIPPILRAPILRDPPILRDFFGPNFSSQWSKYWYFLSLICGEVTVLQKVTCIYVTILHS